MASFFLYVLTIFLLFKIYISSNSRALNELSRGTWVKFISGASNQDLSFVRNLCLLYTLAGVDCIDLSADPAVVDAAYSGIEVALQMTSRRRQRPYIMISVNDDEDPHFRKAYFDSSRCPPQCPRPCERVCPAFAISSMGVSNDRCYGCGRCLGPGICPIGLIESKPFVVDSKVINRLLHLGKIDAIEIHTRFSDKYESNFNNLLDKIGNGIFSHCEVIAVSFPDMGNSTIEYMSSLQRIFSSHVGKRIFDEKGGVHIWQTDGRPMSGDIGKGTARASATFAAKILADLTATDCSISVEGGRHFVQLAGGTNEYSVQMATDAELVGAPGFGGYAFGGYARKTILQHLSLLEAISPGFKLEDSAYEHVFELCLDFAKKLVNTVKKNL